MNDLSCVGTSFFRFDTNHAVKARQTDSIPLAISCVALHAVTL